MSSEDTASGAGAAGAAAQGAASDKKVETGATDKGTDTAAAAAAGGSAGAKTAIVAGDDKAAAAAGDKAVVDKATDADFRSRMAKGDEKVAKRLERYASEADVANALVHAQDRIAKGLKPTLDPKATPEEVKQFRELHGVPEKPEEYKLELANGRVVGDEDRPMVDAFLKDMHAAHAPPALVNAAVNAYYARQDAAVEAREDLDIDQKVACTTELKEDYGPEHKENMRAVVGLLDQAPAELGKALHDARLPDGTLLFNDPRMVRWMVQLAKDLNPAATVVPGNAGNAAQTLTEKIGALTTLMATRDLTADERKQLTALNEAQERLDARLSKAA